MSPSQNSTDGMRFIVRCPYCNWKYRHYEHQAAEAEELKVKHLSENCVLMVPCSACGASPTEPCRSQSGNPVSAHTARRRLVGERNDRRALPRV